MTVLARNFKIMQVNRRNHMASFFVYLKLRSFISRKFKGRNMQERLNLQIRESISFLNNFTYKSRFQESREIFKEVLMEWSWKTRFDKLIKNMCYQIRYIQLRLRKAINVV